MYKEEDFLMISGIQHFVFCKRQWALIHLENQWAENRLTAEGRIIHKRVHRVDEQDWRNGILTIRGLSVKSRELGITGVCDAIEFTPDAEGVPMYGRDGLWQLTPVEYKHGLSKAEDCDRFQLLAQAICLEEMFCAEIDHGFLFYHENRRRERVEFTQELREKLCVIVDEMHHYYSRIYTPKVKKKKVCRSCSLLDICMPSVISMENHSRVQDYIRHHTHEKTT